MLCSTWMFSTLKLLSFDKNRTLLFNTRNNTSNTCYSFAIKQSMRYSAAALHKIVPAHLHCEPHFLWQLLDLSINNFSCSSTGEQKRGAHLIVNSQHESYQGHLETRPVLRTVIYWDGSIWWLKFSCLKVLGKHQQNRVKFSKEICLIKESNQATCQRTNLEEEKKRSKPAKPRTLSKERLTGRMRSELEQGVQSLGKGSVTFLALLKKNVSKSECVSVTILVVQSASHIWQAATADRDPGDNEQIPGLRVLAPHSKNTLETWTKQNWPGFSQAHLAYKYMGFSNGSEHWYSSRAKLQLLHIMFPGWIHDLLQSVNKLKASFSSL